jgi:hypothetical protein
MRARFAIMILAGSAMLGGCAYGFGTYGSYGSYGSRGGVSVGVSYGSGYGGYDSPYGYYGGYGYPDYYDRYGNPGWYRTPYWGWHGGYYYPGTGYYVYDRDRRRYRWNPYQQRYWGERRQQSMQEVRTSDARTLRPNWGDFNRPDRNDVTGDRPRTNIP